MAQPNDPRTRMRELGFSEPSAPIPAQAQIDYLVDRISEALRRKALPVREQAHHVPPFFAQPLSFRFRDQLALPAALPNPNVPFFSVPLCFTPQAQSSDYAATMSFNNSGGFITANIPQPVPDRTIAVLWPSLQVHMNDHDAVLAMSVIRWNMELNGTLVPAICFAFPGGGEVTNNDNGAIADHPHGYTFRDVQLAAPIIMRGGDRARFTIWSTAPGPTSNLIFDLHVRGYTFPDEMNILTPQSMNVE